MQCHQAEPKLKARGGRMQLLMKLRFTVSFKLPVSKAGVADVWDLRFEGGSACKQST